MNSKVRMENTYWQKQIFDKPLFGDTLWNKPENRAHAGKLLIIGGNLHAVTAPGHAYPAAQKAGIGTIRLLLPDAIQKTIGKLIPEADFAPSTPSGSFSQKALSDFLENAKWADGTLLAGDFGKNSETTVLLESFLSKYKGVVCLSGDSLDYFIANPDSLSSRPHTLVVTDLSTLQKLALPRTLIKSSMNLHNLVEALSRWTIETKLSLITNHNKQVIVAHNGQVSTSPFKQAGEWRTELASYATTWIIQQPSSPFEALTTAVFDYIK